MSQGIGGVGHAEAEILADFQLGVSVPLAIRQFMAQLVYTVHTSLHLCWKENLLNNQKVSKCYEHNSRLLALEIECISYLTSFWRLKAED